jgi:uncharacterized protein
VLGIAIGWATAAFVTTGAVRLIVGVVALSFFLRWAWMTWRAKTQTRPHGPVRAGFWGMISGFTSFVAHAGGPPYQVYALALGQRPTIYVGTSVIFFAVINAVKVVPYFALGQFDTTNLAASAILAPIAPVATLAGAYLVRRMKPEVFYPFMYAMLPLIGTKLIYDGIVELWG